MSTINGMDSFNIDTKPAVGTNTYSARGESTENLAQELSSNNSEKVASYDIGSNMGFEKSGENGLACCYHKFYEGARKELLEYEQNNPDRESDTYEGLCFKVEMYGCLEQAYREGDLEKLLTGKEAEDYARNRINSEKEKNPYWKDYENARLKFIEVEKSCAPDSETYKRALQDYQQKERLAASYTGEDAQVYKEPSRRYMPVEVKNAWQSTFLDQSNAAIMKSKDLVKSRDGNFSVSVGGNLDLSHDLGQEKYNINQHICSSELTGKLGAYYTHKGLQLSSSLRRTYSPSFESGGEVNSTAGLSLDVMYNSKKFNLYASYSGAKLSGMEGLNHTIDSSAGYNPVDTVSVSLSHSRSFGTYGSSSYTANIRYRSRDNKYNVSGEYDITNKTAEIKGTVKF